MKDTTIAYELRAYSRDKGWQVIGVPKSAVTRNDYLHYANSLRDIDVQALVYQISTTVETRLIYQNFEESES